MERVEICAECGKPLEHHSLVDLVVSYEIDDETDEIFEQEWHKACYVKYFIRRISVELPPCDCGMGDASMPELHADDCAVYKFFMGPSSFLVDGLGTNGYHFLVG
jgi:hypothetical protein